MRGQRESPLLDVVPDVQLRGIAEDVFRFLRCIAVGIALPIEFVEGREGQMVCLIDQPQLLPQVRGLLAVVAESRLLVNNGQDTIGGIPVL